MHTFTLDDPSRQIVVNVLDPVDTINPPNTQAKCTDRRTTLKVERELKSAPGVWATIAISSNTGRVRLTAQTIRSDGTFAGTNTVAGYITPAGVEL